jgi:hypothetical protein
LKKGRRAEKRAGGGEPMDLTDEALIPLYKAQGGIKELLTKAFRKALRVCQRETQSTRTPAPPE